MNILSKKASIIAITIVFVLVVNVAFAVYAGDSYVVSGQSEGIRGLSETYSDSIIDYKYVYSYFYLQQANEEEYYLQGGNTKAYDQYYVMNLQVYTPDVTVSAGDKVIIWGYHGVGETEFWVDDEWTSREDYEEPSLLNAPSVDYQKSILSKTNSSLEISVAYNLSDEFISCNIFNKQMVDGIDNYLMNSFIFNVELPFQQLMVMGDTAPSYWFDLNSNVVYIGTKHHNGVFLMCTSKWKIQKDGLIAWTELKQF